MRRIAHLPLEPAPIQAVVVLQVPDGCLHRLLQAGTVVFRQDLHLLKLFGERVTIVGVAREAARMQRARLSASVGPTLD